MSDESRNNSPNPNKFDRDFVTKRVTETINARWRDMVTTEHGGPHHSPAELPPVQAAMRLRAGLDRGIADLSPIAGKLGEYQDPQQFIADADRYWDEVFVKHYSEKGYWLGMQSESPANPSWSMAQFIVREVWEKLFFIPQRPNASRMVHAIKAAAQGNSDAARDTAYKFLCQLKDATIEPGLAALRQLISEIITFLQVYYQELPPLEAMNSLLAANSEAETDIYSANERKKCFNYAIALFDQAAEGAARDIDTQLSSYTVGTEQPETIFQRLAHRAGDVASTMMNFDSNHANYARELWKEDGDWQGENPFCESHEKQISDWLTGTLERLPASIASSCKRIPTHEGRGWDDVARIARDKINNEVRRFYAEQRKLFEVRRRTMSQSQQAAKGYANDEPGSHWDAPTKARNKWIYESVCKGTTYKIIIAELNKKPKSWDRIFSVNGIKRAAKEYAKVMNLPPPLSRRPGRR